MARVGGVASQIISSTQNYRFLGICENIQSFLEKPVRPCLVAVNTELYQTSCNRIFDFIRIQFSLSVFKLSFLGLGRQVFCLLL